MHIRHSNPSVRPSRDRIMRIIDLKVGQRARRNQWHRDLHILKGKDNKLYYINPNNQAPQTVKSHSSSYEHKDFIIIGDNNMKYENTNYIVIESKDSQQRSFETEDQALEYIEDRLENSPRSKFTVFTPNFKVEPKRQSLKELITKIL